MKKILFLIVFISCSFAAFSRNGGGLLLQLGVGGSSVNYGNEIDDLYDNSEKNGANRLSIYFDGLVGFSVTDNTYFTLSLSGVSDKVEASYYFVSESFTTTTYLIGIGFRNFPFETGLYLGADIGYANMKMEYEATGQGSVNDDPYDGGFGGAVKLGYDFDTNHRGPSLSLAGSLSYILFEENELFPESEFILASVYVTLNFR